MSNHRLTDPEDTAIDLLRSAGFDPRPLAASSYALKAAVLNARRVRACVALAHMNEEIMAVVLRIVEAHPGDLPFQLCLHSGERPATILNFTLTVGPDVQEPLAGFLGRFAGF